MVRPKSSVHAHLVPVVLAMAVAAGCSSAPEQPLIQKYFQASRLRDNGTLGNIATVSFSPTEDGIVQSFTIDSVGAEQRRPLQLKSLAEAEAAAQKADEEFNKKKKEFQDANGESINRILKAEAARQTLRGKDAEIQKAWSDFRSQTAEYSKKLSDARKALSSERSLTEVSAFDARTPVDPSKFDGDSVNKDVNITAKVKRATARSRTRSCGFG